MQILNIECNITLFNSEKDSFFHETIGYLLLNLTENLMATIWVRAGRFFFHIKNILAVEFPKGQHL